MVISVWEGEGRAGAGTGDNKLPNVFSLSSYMDWHTPAIAIHVRHLHRRTILNGDEGGIGADDRSAGSFSGFPVISLRIISL